MATTPPALHRRRRADALAQALLPAFESGLQLVLEPHEVEAVLVRFDRWFPDVHEAIEALYGDDHDIEAVLGNLLRVLTAAAAARSDELRRRDRRREIDSDWFLDERMVGYVAYADRYAGSLKGVRDRLDHLEDLGVTYLHLLPLLQPRPRPNDGGYAVQEYREVDERLGTMADLEDLAEALHERDMALCVDLVVNHTAEEHAWAQAARAGDPIYRDYYRIFPDRTVPDRYEETLWEVFPHIAPGNFTWRDDLQGWVWTSFNTYQWDLNYENPAVFTEMLDVILFLANRGVDAIRLDAVPFLWKRLGTDCQNLDEAHLILQAWRGLTAIVAPATIFKAEAIVAPGELVKYLGARERQRPECQLAYNNQLMVMSWSSLASRDTRLMTNALSRMVSPPPGTTWVTYVRCHDDIGWAVTDEDAWAVGINAYDHKDFLNQFYRGEFPFSFAKGEEFGRNPETGDARMSGSCASLVGVEQALHLEDDDLLDQALRRMELLYGIAMAYGGIPLIWMGDELALVNDWEYAQQDPAHAGDNRWLHRPEMDWALADRARGSEDVLAGRMYAALRRLVTARAATPHLHGAAPTQPLWTDRAEVFAFVRRHPAEGPLLGLANFADVGTSIDLGVLGAAGLGRELYDVLSPDSTVIQHDRLQLDRLQVRWLIAD